MLHTAAQEPKNIDLDRFRQRKHKWWITVPLVLLVGIGVWYLATLLLAYQNVTTKNVNGGSILLSSEKKQNEGQINILLIGIGGESHPGGNLADTIMVASVDTRSKSISLLSVPRDLYVPIPGNGKDKINTAHAFGESKSGKKGGGPILLKQVVSETLDVPIHYFIRVDFEGFKKIIDTIGGITITVKTPINDPHFPDEKLKGFDPFRISAGTHKMDGKTALKYARSRETTSDFDRARRQQEVLIAMKEKMLSAQVLANPKKVTGIISILGKHLLTDFNATEIEQLLGLGRSFDNPTVKTQVLGSAENGLVVGGRAPNGGSIQVPRIGANDFSEIQAFARAYFNAAAIKTEQPSILIENTGTSKTIVNLLAKQLEWAGFTVKTSEETPSSESPTVLYDYTDGKKPLSSNYLTDAYAFTSKKKTPSTTTLTTDYVLSVGKDFPKAALYPKQDKEALKTQSSPILNTTSNSTL